MRGMTEQAKIAALFDKLTSATLHSFPAKRVKLEAPTDKGVYIIYSPKGVVLHVGQTPRGRKGLRQRLTNHLRGRQSSFARHYLKGNGSRLRNGYRFGYLVIGNARQRALLEAYTIGHLCPRHIGLGQLRE